MTDEVMASSACRVRSRAFSAFARCSASRSFAFRSASAAASAFASFASAMPRCFASSARARSARIIPNVVPTMPPTRASSTRLAASTGPRFRRRNLLKRYPADGGRASTASSAR